MTKVTNAYGQKRVPKNYTENTDSVGVAYTPGIYIGVVKKNDDAQNMGRLKVYIKEFGGDPRLESSWISVSYASPFAGSTSIYNQGTNFSEYDDTMKSYGFWAVPPDLEAHVLVAFIAGKVSMGYWFACLYQRGTQVSVPGIPAGRTATGDNKPVAPKNHRDPDPDLEKYVEHKPMSSALKKQGLENDPLRGAGTSGVTRESPSKVIGLLTPGQHQLVLDDGDKDGNNKLIRLRTSNGTQILLDDVAGHIYLITKEGKNWVELNGDGSVHVYSDGDVNVRAENNINLKADNDINIEAGSSINLKAVEGSINLEAASNFNSFAFKSTKITSVETSNINSGTGHYETAGEIHMNGPAAAAADPISTYNLTINQSAGTSICNTVPEHEPWSGHGGLIIPVGHGNQQMRDDPAPDQQPRSPENNEQGAAIKVTNSEQGPTVEIEKATTSPEAQDLIKKNNGFSPVNVNDAGAQSGGFGSVIVPKEPELTPTETRVRELSKDFIENSGLSENTKKLVAQANGTKTRDPETPSEADKNTVSLSAGVFQKFKEILSKSNAAGAQIDSARQAMSPNSLSFKALVTSITNIFGGSKTSGNPIKNDVINTLASGIDRPKAESMFAKDIESNEKEVRRVLKANGVNGLPQNVFDGLVSYQNQVGNINYAYVRGDKIDLTGLYRQRDWKRVASFIAADERDRARRIQEAAMIANNSYPLVNLDRVVNKGYEKADELIAKEKLNQQTGDPATPQQLVAAATSYWDQNQEPMPSQDFVFNNLIANKNVAEEIKTNQPGPFPY